MCLFAGATVSLEYCLYVFLVTVTTLVHITMLIFIKNCCLLQMLYESLPFSHCPFPPELPQPHPSCLDAGVSQRIRPGQQLFAARLHSEKPLYCWALPAWRLFVTYPYPDPTLDAAQTPKHLVFQPFATHIHLEMPPYSPTSPQHTDVHQTPVQRRLAFTTALCATPPHVRQRRHARVSQSATRA